MTDDRQRLTRIQAEQDRALSAYLRHHVVPYSAFYRDRLGFDVEALYDDPPYATLAGAGMRLSLAEQGHAADDRPGVMMQVPADPGSLPAILVLEVADCRLVSVAFGSYEAWLSSWSGLQAEPETAALVPVHPWQLCLSPIVRELLAKGLAALFRTKIEAIPLASQRTCRVVRTGFDLKLPVDATLTGETVVGNAVIASSEYSTATPSQIRMTLPDGLTSFPVSGLVSGSLSAFPVVASGSAQQRTLVLDGGTLIDGTGKPPIRNAVVVVEGHRVEQSRGRAE